MTKEQVENRIKELIQLQQSDTLKRAEKMAEAEIKKQELNLIQNEIDKLNWNNKPEKKELEELQIVMKYMEE